MVTSAFCGELLDEDLELAAGFRIALRRDQKPRIVQSRVFRFGIRPQIIGEEFRGLVARAALQRLRLEERGELPVRPQLERGGRFAERERLVVPAFHAACATASRASGTS